MKRHLASFVLCALATTAAAAEYPAELDWSQRVILSTPVSGVVDTVSAGAGERVTSGQALLQLDQRPFETALMDAKAQLHKQKLLRDEARREVGRVRELYERTVISVHDLQLGEIAFAVAEADHASAVAALNDAQLRQEHSILHAPFDGRVLSVQVSTGMTVINTEQATPLVTLARDRPMHARVRVEAAALAGLSPGQAATVTLDGARFEGRLRSIGAEPDGDGRYALTVEFDPGEVELRAGLPARVDISR